MTNDQRQEFGRILAATLSMYRVELTRSLLDIWWEDLSYFELDSVRQALSMHRRNPDNGQYPPKPADITRLIGGGTTRDRAITAWNKVFSAISSVGAHNSVVFDDALIHAVIPDMGGWAAICQGEQNELPYRQKEFENRYRAYLFNPPKRYFKKLAGIAETTNVAAGQPIDPPIAAGDPELCRLVFEGGVSGAKPLGVLNIDQLSNVIQLGYSAA
ncbi:DUF6475 domain-containing protein [Vibrio quintilis]|uniref:DUF6475 domain-containing protein n=1 Tax=Vibrio quintilis TaxID=1117707 RepID=A0A1M7YP79_9VIBR|nr:DUF6475 domain-containing protein [Vibrio quintilis]SHO54385.1 hypothetical protein VQ7734_00099 [Vibrio quintilis]